MKISTKAYQRNLPVNFLQKDISLFQKELNFRLPEFEVKAFRNVVVVSEQVIFKFGRRISGIFTRANKISFKKRLKIIRREIINLNQAVFLTDVWSTNYFHWFTDTLPRLLLAEKHFPDIPVIIPAHFDQFPYITESLSAFNKTEIIWLRNYQKAKVKELIFIPHTAPTGNYNEELIREVGKKLRRFFGLNQLSAKNKIMISRQGALNRKIINHDEVKSVLDQFGVSDIMFEQKEWQEQIQIVAKSSILIGVHGAGLTNMLFMSPSAKVVELRRKDDNHNNCYFSLASALKMEYYYLLCEVDNYEKQTQQNNFVVSNKSFFKLLKDIID